MGNIWGNFTDAIGDILSLTFGILLIIGIIGGEIRCVYKMVSCNWEPVGKAEIFYTVGTFTGFGSIIGWIDIEDK